MATLCCWVSVTPAEPFRQAEPFRLVYSSSAGCGAAPAFLSELKSRTSLLREAQRDEHAITLIVETFDENGGVRGQLTVRKPDGELSVREVPGSSCREVESAMALIAALMVDPLAAGLESQSFPPPPAEQPLATVAAPELGWRFEQRLTARSAIAPALTWGQAWGSMVTLESSGWRPSLGLSLHLARATTSAVQGSAELEWAAGQLSFCPAGYQPSAAWDLRACAELQMGRLRGAGFQTESRATKALLWVSAGLAVEARYQLLAPLWVGCEAGITLPFSRQRFYLEPEQTLHRIPAWGGALGVGMGLRFF